MPTRKLTDTVVLRAQQLRSGGWTYDQIARDLGVSIESARKACKAPRSEAAVPVVAAAPEVGATEPQAAAPEELSPLATLTALAKALNTTLAGPLDSNAQLSVIRLSKDVSLAIAKLSPPPPPDHENAPDMIEAREAFRARLREALEREGQRRAEAEQCTQCGAPKLTAGEESPVAMLVRWCLDG